MAGKLHCSIRHDLHALVAAERLEVTEIELKAVLDCPNDLRDVLAVGRIPVGRQTHDFAFVTIFAVANEFANHGVEAAKGMGQENAVEHFNFVAFTTSHHGGDEISRAVITESGSLFPGRAV